ncbi:putative RING finger protein P32A8.03c [Hypsizygus marmoreus]|uniref:RING finger protein P32A8.03c n=1 Tax=Hypsizygus marmoreus TaxID=39966 RepID=A0A369K638_HYPMA|nr:putative RING finger protein P32A8.03c [Hypsizygus marmoreus]
MSSREPLWFCHECHAEMRPLMVPDPVCASCQGSFVEKMENPADDPREFAHHGPGDFDAEGLPPGMDAFLFGLQALVDRGTAEGRTQPSRVGSGNGASGNRLTFQISGGSSQRPNIGGRSGSGTGSSGPVPTIFIRRDSDTPQGTSITGPLMAQYLMALLGQRDPLNDLVGRDLSDGRMGDYVFNQEALDQIITQLMENSNAHRPVPATEEIISNLPREVLEYGSPMLEKDCAVCKEQFKLETEDPDEQVVVTLPCKHPFHEPCILPWLKSSGTCPVCRHALIPQPEHQSPPAGGPSTNPDSARHSPDSSRSRSPRRDPDGHDATGILHSLFGGFVGGRGHTQAGGNGHNRSNSDPALRSSGRGTDSRNNVPGSWEDLD